MSVSIIIPTLNEADNIAAVVESARLAGACEVIVIDGRSEDETAILAEQAGVDVVLQTAPGRGRQLNLGFEHSTRDYVLFLHADCRLPKQSLLHCVAGLKHDSKAIGYFRQAIRAKGFRYRLLEAGNARRARWAKLIYGDQGMMLHRDRFLELGCFPDAPFMEDFLFCRRLSWFQSTICLPGVLSVSPRRWEQQGIFWQTMINWQLTMRSYLGLKPEENPDQYPAVRDPVDESPGIESTTH